MQAGGDPLHCVEVRQVLVFTPTSLYPSLHVYVATPPTLGAVILINPLVGTVGSGHSLATDEKYK